MSDKIKKEIFNGVGENVRALAQLFPSAVKDGEVDFSALKQELGEFVEVGAEKYDFTWAGKAKAKAESVSDILGRTLKYVKGDGVNEDTTQNLYIEGDNLEALKLLRNSYYNKIKMIYIDPPYNTGNDGFVYPDDFSVDRAVYEQSVGDRDENDIAMRFVKSNKDAGDYHTKWLNFMCKRLCVARDLLTDDGVIFISIDDNEQSNLKKLCDEVFGESNFVAELIHQRAKGGGQAKYVVKGHDYILTYGRNVNNLVLTRKKVIQQGTIEINGELFIKNDDIVRKVFGKYDKSLGDRRCFYEELVAYKGLSKKNEIDEKIRAGEYFLEEKNGKHIICKYEKVEDAKSKLYSIIKVLSEEGKKDIEGLGIECFSYPKPIELIRQLIDAGSDKDTIILDFFSGSATTAHAVMQLNAEDGGNRKYICVQVPEPCAEDSEAFKAGYKNICEIGKERIRRAGKKIAEENKITASNLDIGFKVFKVADTNIRMFSNELNNVNVFGQIDIKDIDPEQIDFNNGATDLDVCYELLLRHRGIPLSSKVDKLSIGERTYMIADSIVVCLDKQVTESLVEQLAAIDPLPNKYIFRDSSFGDDISLKENTMIYLQAIIEKNSGASKKAYTVEFI